MATITFKKGDEYLYRLSKLAAGSREKVCGSAIYAAADIVADAIRQELESVPTDEGFGTPKDPVKGIKAVQKEALLQSLGITKMQDRGDGYLDVKIGFDGYNPLKTKRWPNGQPNQLIARSLESGTTWMTKTPFVKRAVTKSKKKALEEMKKSVQTSIEKIMK